MLSVITIRKMKIKITAKHHFTHSRISVIKIKCVGEDVETLQSSCGGPARLQPLCESLGSSS